MGDLRRVQRTPGGTFFVCIPKSWAKQQKLSRGDVVDVVATGDGKLLIDPLHDVEQTRRVADLKADPYLSREIVEKYLLGFDIIRVDAKKGIDPELRELIKSTVGRLIGLEIVEENYSTIVLQCLLDPSGFPPDKILRRSYAIAAAMHRDVVSALVDGDVPLAENIVVRDNEVNRLYFLLVRILRTIVQNAGLSEKLGVRPIECLDYRLAASFVEAIGDECVRAAMKVIDLRGLRFDEDLRRLFVDFHSKCFGAHERALRAFFTSDTSLAESVRNTRTEVEKVFAGVEKIAKAQSLNVVPQILAVATVLLRIFEHSVDIADLVMPK